MNGTRARGAAAYLPLLAISGLMVLPLVFLVSTSLKSLPETLADPPTFWPRNPRVENFREAFTTFPFWRYLGNTLVIVAGKVAGTLLSCALVAWGFARYKVGANNLLFLLLLSTMMLPAQVTAIPVFSLFLKLGLYNTYAPLILPAWLGTNAFFVFLLKQFFEAIPEELINAARLDGAGELRAFLSVGLPLSKPILWTVAVFTFIWSWNDYFTPLLYLIDERLFPLSLGLIYFKQASTNASFGTQWNLLMAVSLVAMIPTAVLFFFAQRSFIENAQGGGLKQ